MRFIRLVLPTTVALAVAAGTATAQATTDGGAHGRGTGHGAGHGAAHAAERAAARSVGWDGELPKHFEGITLTEEQKTEVAALQRLYHARMDAMRDSAKAAGAAPDAPALQAELEQVMAEEHADFRALLDKADRARFDANLARMHAGSHGAGHGTAQVGRPPRG